MTDELNEYKIELQETSELFTTSSISVFTSAGLVLLRTEAGNHFGAVRGKYSLQPAEARQLADALLARVAIIEDEKRHAFTPGEQNADMCAVCGCAAQDDYMHFQDEEK